MSLPFTQQQCFYIAIFAFMVLGFQRGWRRELVSLVFILLAVFLVHPDTSNALGSFLGRLPVIIGYLGTNSAPPPAQPVSFLGGPMWSLIIFIGMVILGYYAGNKLFSGPTTPQDRFFGIIPALVAGAFVLSYLSSYLPRNPVTGQPTLSLNVASPDPTNYIPVIFVIAIVALVIALIAARSKKAPAKK